MEDEKRSPLQAIKLFCMICQGVERNQSMDPVKKCAAGKPFGVYDKCPLYPYRMGRGSRTLSDEEKKKSSERLKKWREEQKEAK